MNIIDNKKKKTKDNVDIQFLKGTVDDINELALLYDTLHDYLEQTTNYPGWIKGIYPIRETAETGIKNDHLFVLKARGEIAASVILSHEPETAYSKAIWRINTSYDNIIVIHTLVVHPKFMKLGIGIQLMDFAKSYALKLGMKAIRLDVSIHNSPAISLYEKSGYHYIDTVDLGLEYKHLKWFKLYELLL